MIMSVDFFNGVGASVSGSELIGGTGSAVAVTTRPITVTSS